MTKLTKHQRETLLRLARLSRTQAIEGVRPDGFARWILDKDCGGPAALEHLYDKGYVERQTRRGPRGGYHYYYRPNDAGVAVRERHVAKTRVAQAANEIDTRLIEARKTGSIVRVFCGPVTEYRGVPGEVERVDDWDKGTSTVVLNIGARKIPLAAITKVEAA